MQYKIPVQIENEDPIFLGLSLRQLTIIMIGGSIAYGIFQTLAPQTGGEIALIPSGAVALITIAIAVFKIHEMTFIPFVLSFIRFSVYGADRTWDNGVDSFQPIDVGHISAAEEKKQEDVDMTKKIDTMETLQEKLKKI